MNRSAMCPVLLWTMGLTCSCASGFAAAQQLYRITDLGTLGGRSSSAGDMNEKGQVAGTSLTTSGKEHVFLWNGTRMRDVGSLGGDFGYAAAINNRGQITGNFFLPGNQTHHAFLWTGSDMKDLGALGLLDSHGNDINEAGQVAGGACPENGLDCRAFLWDGNTMRDLGPVPGGRDSFGNALNNKGQVVGTGYMSDGTLHAFFWNGTTMLDLGTLGGANSDAQDLNSAGQITGSADTGEEFNFTAYLWDNGLMQDLGAPLGFIGSSGSAINAKGWVTGSAYDNQFYPHAFLWNGSEMLDIHTVAGGYSYAEEINLSGQVMGEFVGNDGARPFLWDGTAMRDLNDLIDPQDPLRRYVTLLDGVALNNRGQIAANGNDVRLGCCDQHAYVVTPMEYHLRLIEPATSSKWKRGTTVRIRAVLVDAEGSRITDARANSLIAAPCKIKFSATGAQGRTALCMRYDASENVFYFNWKLDPAGTGSTTSKVSATYKFSMPEAITTTRRRTISIVH